MKQRTIRIIKMIVLICIIIFASLKIICKGKANYFMTKKNNIIDEYIISNEEIETIASDYSNIDEWSSGNTLDLTDNENDIYTLELTSDENDVDELKSTDDANNENIDFAPKPTTFKNAKNKLKNNYVNMQKNEKKEEVSIQEEKGESKDIKENDLKNEEIKDNNKNETSNQTNDEVNKIDKSIMDIISTGKVELPEYIRKEIEKNNNEE